MYKKKSLGQHFLRSKGALHKIVGAAKLSPVDTVLEVGPGEGVLTELLLQKAGKVIAVEKDDRLIPVLQEKFKSEIAAGRLELIHADILDVLPSSFGLRASLPAEASAQAGDFKVVANIPYYITGALLRKFLESEKQPSTMVLLTQKEVAKRIVASDRRESILSISVKAYGTPKYIDTVKAGSFSPPPRVDSAIIAVEDISKRHFLEIPPAEDGSAPFRKGRIEEKKFFELLKKGFAHPRKLLASNIGQPQEVLPLCGIEKKSRAEDVTLAQWLCLSSKANLPPQDPGLSRSTK